MFGENLAKPRFKGTLEVYKSIIAYPESLYSPILVAGRPEIWLVSDHIKERLYELHQGHKDVFEILSREIWSCEVGKIKGDSGFFKDILDKYGLTPEEVVFVDDLYVNIRSAESAGLTSIQFENAADLKNELSELGFEFY